MKLPRRPRRTTGKAHPRPTPSRLAGYTITVALLVLLTLAALLLTDHLYDPNRFRIHNIEVRGPLTHVQDTRLKQVVKTALTGNYFSLNLPHIESQVEHLPGVFSASIRRHWPDTLIVQITEVQPVARWGTDHWLHFTGDLVPRTPTNTPTPDTPTTNLPLLTGPSHRRHDIWHAFRRWSDLFASTGLHLDQLHLDPRGLWHLNLSLSALARTTNTTPTTDTNTTLNTPTTVTLIVAEHDAEHDASHDTRRAAHPDAEARIHRFLKASAPRLIAEFPAMQTIDLRYPHGFAIGWKDTPTTHSLAGTP